MEIEAKYTVSDPAIFDTLHELRGLGDYALRPTRDRDLIDHYLDTPNRDLLSGGYACRLREGEAVLLCRVLIEVVIGAQRP